MLKRLIVLFFVTFMHHSVDGLTNDAQSKADECFIKNCRHTFLVKLMPNLMCGSDYKPYIHHFSFGCARRCASNYGLELTVVHERYCEGKLPVWDYWADIMEL